MARKFLTGIDLSLSELLNALLHKVAGNPAAPTEGQVWYDTLAKRLKFQTDAATIDPTARANHSGTQTAATISDLPATIRAVRVDELAAPTGALAMNNQRITGLATPTGSTDAATKDYVDLARQGVRQKDAVRAASTANLVLSGTQTIDGVNVVAGDRVLAKDQTAPAQNGIYVVAAGAWARASDADTAAEVNDGATVWVQQGTVNADKAFTQTVAVVTIGTDAQTWVLQGSSNSYLGGAGLVLNGSTFDVVGAAGGGITVNADSIQLDTTVAARHVAGALTGGATSEVVTHNLGTRDVLVRVRNNASPWEEVEVDVEATTINTVTLRGAANLPAGYRWLVVG